MGTVSAQSSCRRSGSGDARERLLDAAYAQIVSGGWGDRRMVDIAAAAGVSRQTLYNAFGSKEGLLQAVVLREADRFLDEVMQPFTGHLSDPAHAVGQAARRTLVTARKDPLLRAVITGDRELLPVLTTRAGPLHEAMGERMTRVLRERCPEVPAGVAEAVAEVALRLTVSYALQPIDTDLAARRVEMVVQSMLFASRAGDITG